MDFGRFRDAAATMLIFIVMEAIVVGVVFGSPVFAHEAAPARVDLVAGPDGGVLVTVETDAAAVLARLDGLDHDAHRDRGRDEIEAALGARFAVGADIFRMRGAAGPVPLSWQGFDLSGRMLLRSVAGVGDGVLEVEPAALLGPAVIRTVDASQGAVIEAVFASPGAAAAITWDGAAPRGVGAVLADYVVAGFQHILPMGADHILFVIGLFLLSPAARPLLVQVSLFTLAHSVTLVLSALGAVSVPAQIVEPLIAASIAFVALENVMRSSLSRWRPWVVFGFGLLHGLGFASVLAEFGLPATHVLPALLGFNLGVEIGQLTVLAGCFAAACLVLRRPWYRRVVAIPASLVLALIGTVWFAERIVEGIA